MYNEIKLIIFIIPIFLIPCSTSISTISHTQKIKDGDLLVSDGGAFALGFFSPGKSSNRYVGIWYNKIPEQTIVWVANRDNPINNSTGVLVLDMRGNLVISGQDQKNTVWSTNITTAGQNSTYFAHLMDTGNLVLFQEDGHNKVVAWQSFDYPTHTLLPFMKHGVDLKTGLNWHLTSWKSRDDPGTGSYSFKMDLKGSPPQEFLFKGQDRIWRTGPWNGMRLSGVPQMTQNYIFRITYVENSTEVYIMYNLLDAAVFSRMILDDSGVMKRLTWHADRSQWVEFWSAPKDQCDYYNHCGPYGICNNTNQVEFECQCLPGYKPKSPQDWYLRDGSGGCVAKNGTCGVGDGFLKVTGGKLPDTNDGYVNRSIGLEECKVKCVKNCSCKGYSSANISPSGGESGCITWHGELIDTREFSSGGQDFYLRVDALQLAEYKKSQQSKGKKSILPYILGPVAGVLVAFICLILYYVKRKRKGNKKAASLLSPNFSTTSLGATSTYGKILDDSGTNTDLPHVDLNTIIEATDSFSFANKLGEGGFGTVYKGVLANGQEIAVKRLAKNSGQGEEEFKNEVTLIAKLQHRNLVRLLGFCIRQEEKMLIYEYLPNKGLDSIIFDKSKGSLVDWRKRHEIIMGIARGLLYLHQDSRLRIIHRDLKASNVLLDASMNPKISDFGMARIFGGDQIEANTNRVVGTYGYMSPEYAMQGHFSIKSDVFSFGVLLLEIISGTKNNSYYLDSSVNLIGHVWSLWKEDKSLEAVDPRLEKSSYEAHEVLKCINIGLLCVEEHAIDRPTMSDVAFMLSHETILPAPKEPAFILKARTAQQHSSSTSVGASSGNDLTITQVEAR